MTDAQDPRPSLPLAADLIPCPDGKEGCTVAHFDSRPSLERLRRAAERVKDTPLVLTRKGALGEMAAALPILLDIAEAAQAVAHEAEFYADDDTPDDSLIVVPRADMKKLDEALTKVRP